jgi:hypothetical protein
MMRGRIRTGLGILLCLAGGAPAAAWPADLARSIARDARRLVPRSLADILARQEAEVVAEARVAQMRVLPLLYADLSRGRVSAATQGALAEDLSARVEAFRGKSFRAGVIGLGGAYRLAVDLADPALGSGLGGDAKAAALRREFYLFVAANRDKIPLVVAPQDALGLRLEAVPGFLAQVAAATPAQSTRLRDEGLEGGRVLLHDEIDFRSPVFAVASTAYSRSVTAVAATWIAVWRASGGDMTRPKTPRTVGPKHPD